MRKLTGTITSLKNIRTAVITVRRAKMHRLYKKTYLISKKYYADIPVDIQPKLGDTVTISECQPISKLKRWKVSTIVTKNIKQSTSTTEEDTTTTDTSNSETPS